MPELDYVSIKGFKSIAALERLELRGVNVVIGPNGSGKSNFIELFAFLHAIRAGRLQEYVAIAGGADRLLYFGSKNTDHIWIRISFQDEKNAYEIRLAPTADDQLTPIAETVYFWDKRYPRPYDQELTPRGGEAGISSSTMPIANYVREHLASWRAYHFHDTSSSSQMKKTADVNDNRFLRHDASNLAAFLYYLREKHPNSYRTIRHMIRLVTPFFDDFNLEPQKLNPDKIRLEWRHKESDAYFDAASLSDGTLRFIALSTLFLQPVDYRPSVILVDEPELGLHPYAVTLLASMVRQASATKTQVILSTQSSLLLDQFHPEDVLVADTVSGGTQLTRLVAEDLKQWLDDYSLGQLWEKNELGGRPGAE